MGGGTGGICQFESFFTALFSASAFFFSAAALPSGVGDNA